MKGYESEAVLLSLYSGEYIFSFILNETIEAVLKWQKQTNHVCKLLKSSLTWSMTVLFTPVNLSNSYSSKDQIDYVCFQLKGSRMILMLMWWLVTNIGGGSRFIFLTGKCIFQLSEHRVEYMVEYASFRENSANILER